MSLHLSRMQLADPAATRAHDEIVSKLTAALGKIGSVSIVDSEASDVATLKADFNRLLLALRTMGVLL